MRATSNDRPSLGFDTELDDFDPAAWVKAGASNTKPDREETRHAAEAAGFRSREPARTEQHAPPPQQRRRRTGRNVQFNIKTRAETIEAFTRIADANGWGLGEAFEHATELLNREHGSK